MRCTLIPILLVVAAGCTPPGPVDPKDDTADTIPPSPCDGQPDGVVCLEGQAVTCAAEAVAGTEDCAEACVDGTGCMSCEVDLAEPLVAEADEETVGVVLVAGHPDTWGGFPAASLALRAVTLTGSPVPGRGVALSVEGEGVSAWAEDGTPLALPVTLAAEDLPSTVLLSGTTGADVVLVARATGGEGCEDAEDRLRVRAETLPGLSGAPLDRFPWFQNVDAFNEGEGAWAALDGDRFPDRAGATADVYVVPHRTPAEWAADPALGVDPVGSVTVGSLEGGAVELGALTTDAVLGTPYDVVWDFDGDGALGPGDLVDGLSGTTPGLTVFGDLTTAGVHETASLQYSGGSWLGQRTWYPTDIADLEPRPLVVISHGNGHDYTWYNWLQEHLASHGYVVMSHQNNTGPGIETASTTTLTNTDWFLANLATIGGGVLDGHVDGSRIVWIGHSRGGEGVVRAYDRIRDGAYTPTGFTADDIVLISSIAPTVFNDVDTSDPHDASYHMLMGAADGDVTGGADCTQCQSLRIAQAAEGAVAVTYVQGAGHNDFNCCGFDDATGPAQIGRIQAQVLGRGVYLALIAWQVDGLEAAGEYFTRMYDDFRPAGIADDVVVAATWRDQLAEGLVVLDDFQLEQDEAISSAGTAVSWTCSDAYEEKLNDGDNSFSWSESDPMNGMTQASDSKDRGRGVVLEWGADEEAAWAVEVPAGARDFTAFTWLSFRAAQQTRHPNTVALAGPLDFSVTLVDGAGVESTISFGSLGGVTTPYARTGLGRGAGWANEFSTVRLRVLDFAAGGAALDLTDVATVRFEFGGAFGSAPGRIGLDDVELIP